MRNLGSMALCLLLGGCWYITPEEQRARLDLDGDGVPAPDDCDDSDPDATTVAPAYLDSDLDGYGAPGAASFFCGSPPFGYAVNETDCDDEDATINPGGSETCDTRDQDCDGTVDNGVTATTWYVDTDGDGYGAATGSVEACAAPDGLVAEIGDCDDAQPELNPGMLEVCGNGLDDNCDGDTAACRLSGVVSFDDGAVVFYGQGGFGSVVTGSDVDSSGTRDTLVGDAKGRVRGFFSPSSTFASAAQADLTFEVDGESSLELAPARLSMDGPTGVAAIRDGTAEIRWNPAPGGEAGPADAQVAVDGGAITSLFTADLDGDGVDETVVAATLEGTSGGVVFVFEGALSGSIDPSTGWTAALHGTSGDPRPTWTGESDDGTARFMLGGTDALFLLHGVPTTDGVVEAADIADTVFVNSQPNGTEAAAARAGDLDGDGSADVLFALANWSDSEIISEKGLVVAFFDTDFGPVLTTDDADIHIAGSSDGERLGNAIAGDCDVDSDGYADILAGASGTTDSGVVFGFYGGVGPSVTLSEDAAFSVRADAGADAWRVTCMGDVNADGRDDFAVAAPGLDTVQEVVVFFGRSW